MTRRCSHCCNNGHNSRTCPNRGVKIFGVRLTDGSIRKSASMGNLSHYAGSGLSSAVPTNQGSPGDTPENGAGADGYASEDFVPGSSSICRERKKGVPWTEEEHRMFLLGLKKLGKGDWRGIARNFVVSRTPTQVASHAQKYFIRQTNISRRKRRSSLFDIISDQPGDVPMMPNRFSSTDRLVAETVANPLPAPPTVDEECESMDSTNSNEGEIMAPPKQDPSLCSFPAAYSGFHPHYFPVTFPIWSEIGSEALKEESNGVFKPKAMYTKSPLNVDELVGLSKLSLGDSLARSGPSSLSINLSQGSARQSAFHANPSSESSKMNSSGSPIHAV